MIGRVLIRWSVRGEGIVVVQHTEIVPRLGPNIVWFRRMNVRIVSARSSQNIVVSGCVSDLLTDVDDLSVHDGECRPAHKAVDEWRVGILKNLLGAAGKFICRLTPVVVFHCDDENLFDLLRRA